MKKLLLAAIVSLFFVGVACATTWTDLYTPESSYLTYGDTEYLNFDIKNDGFDPLLFGGSDVALWAQVELYVTDDLKPWNDPLDWLGTDESFKLTTDFFFWDVNEQTFDVDFHGGVLNDPLSYALDLFGLISLNANGILDLTMDVTKGDFYFWGAQLVATDTNPVPEPGTLLLLGSGLAGLALYRRRSMNN